MTAVAPRPTSASTLAAGGDLLFCGHHFREHEARLRPLASDVHDETAKLTEPTPIAEHEA